MSIDDKINEALGIITQEEKPVTKQVIKKEFTPPVPRMEDKDKKDVENDYKYSRENYYNLIERGQDAIQGILDIAKEGQHPRAYEVAGQLITSVGQTVDKLQDLQKKLKDLKEVPGKVNPTIKNALFVGSTAELQKMLNRKSEDEIIESEAVNTEKDKPGNK